MVFKTSIIFEGGGTTIKSCLGHPFGQQRPCIQVTNNSVKELREELEAIATAAKQTCDRVDSVHAAAREDRRTVTDLRNQLERLTEKMTDIEDRSRRNNVRLVGLPEVVEGSDVAGFLSVNLSKWIPSLKGRNIEIDRAHRVYDGRKNSDRPHTLIFCVLRWHDRSEILKGARQAYPVKCTQDNVSLLFFPDFSPATAARRKSFVPVLRTMTALGLQPFLTYPAVIKLRHGGEQRSFDSLRKAEDFISSLSQKKTFAVVHKAKGRRRPPSLRPGGRGLMAGIEAMPAARKKMVARGIWMLARSLFFFLLSSLLLGYCSYLFDTIVSLLVRLTSPFFLFFFWRGLMESRFNYNHFLVMCVREWPVSSITDRLHLHPFNHQAHLLLITAHHPCST